MSQTRTFTPPLSAVDAMTIRLLFERSALASSMGGDPLEYGTSIRIAERLLRGEAVAVTVTDELRACQRIAATAHPRAASSPTGGTTE